MWEIQTKIPLDKWFQMKKLSTIKLYNSSRSINLVFAISPSEAIYKIKFYYAAPIFRDISKSSRLYKSIFRGGSRSSSL